MKTVRKFLALLVSALMLLSIAAPAFAESFDPAVIDPTRKGSLTIVKTETERTAMKDEDGNPVKDSNGNTVYEVIHKPLADVEFKIYKIADIATHTVDGTSSLVATPVDKLLTAYRSVMKDENATLEITTGTTYKQLEGALSYLLNNSSMDFSAVGSGSTAMSGTGSSAIAAVTFENLDVGVYLAVETDAPSQIVEKSANFLVSIPMAAEANNGVIIGWNYNVVAEPKNEGVYSGAVVLKKEGQGFQSSSALKGVQFKLQQKDENDQWVPYGDSVYTTDDDGEIEVEDFAPGTYRFAEISRGYDSVAKKDLNTEYIIDLGAVYEFSVDDKGKFTSLYANKTAADGLDMIVNNYKPDLNKQVQDRVDLTWGELADYSVGDVIPYRIGVFVPENIAKLKKFTVTDTPVNLIDDVNTVKVDNSAAGTYFTVNAIASTGGFEVVFNPAELAKAGKAGRIVYITYNATLQASAAVGHQADNTATLLYSNEIYPEDAPGNPTPKETQIQDDTIVYTFGIDVTKYLDKVDAGKQATEGVTFELYLGDPKLAKSEKLYFKVDESDNYILCDKDAQDAQSEIEINSVGKINFKGLENGEYYLLEKKTVEGYNLLSSAIKVNLAVSYKAEWSESSVYEPGEGIEADWVLIKHHASRFQQYFGGTSDEPKKAYAEENVLNKKGFTLPATGGLGTMMFYLAGGCMVAFGATLLLGKKAKKAEN